jgi:tRNA A-37 threonylcarbamoyl transferase component Bud32
MTPPPRPVTAARAAIQAATGMAPQGEPAAPVDPYIDTTIADRYRVIRKLGEGGMGVVYLAEHVFIEKKVALKILSEDFARKAELVARFMQEAKAASKIGHEHIVDITDFGETVSGSVFFAMEFLDGMDLAGHIRSGGAMPVDRARHILNQICRALGAAHSKGIIHRDLKPENIYLITREGRGDFVKVLDFGIAKMSALDESGSRLTRTGMIFGTPEYMSPEQARGDKPDHRVDIYATGCILYEMLTGDVPFHAETFMGVLTKHMFEAPVPPSQRNPTAHIPPDVEAVVMKALAKDREQRFQSMQELALALEQCGGGGYDLGQAWVGEPSGMDSAAPFRLAGGSQVVPAVAASTQPPVARSRSGIVVAVLAALVVAIGVGGYFATRKPAPPPVVAVVAPPPPKVVEAPPVVVPPPVVAAKPTQYTMTIATQPKGAEVFNGAEILGTTPCDISLPAGTTLVELMLRKKGWKDQPLKIVPDRNHDFLADLTPLPKAHSSSPHAASKPAAPPTPPAPVAKPAEPPAPNKAAGKLRDLKDPFAN